MNPQFSAEKLAQIRRFNVPCPPASPGRPLTDQVMKLVMAINHLADLGRTRVRPHEVRHVLADAGELSHYMSQLPFEHLLGGLGLRRVRIEGSTFIEIPSGGLTRAGLLARFTEPEG